MKITDMNFLFLTFKNTKKYVKIKLSQNIYQNDIINDNVIIRF